MARKVGTLWWVGIVAVAAASMAIAADGPIELWDAGDRLICAMQPTSEGWSVEVSGGAVIGTLRAEDDRVKLESIDGEVVLKVKLKAYGAEIEDGQGRRLFKLKQDDDGHWKLRSADDVTVLKCKRKSDGFEVRAQNGVTVAKVKARAGGLRYTTEGGEPLYVVTGLQEPEVGLWWVADQLELEQRAAVVAFFHQVR
jgi:hypothetical protein